MRKIHRWALPTFVFALSALVTLAVADVAQPPAQWPGGTSKCEPYAHSDTTQGGCYQCCEDNTAQADPIGDMGWLYQCEGCCNVRNNGDPNGPKHCIASYTADQDVPKEANDATL